MRENHKQIAAALETMLDEYRATNPPQASDSLGNLKAFLAWARSQKTTITHEEFVHARENIRMGGRKTPYDL